MWFWSIFASCRIFLNSWCDAKSILHDLHHCESWLLHSFFLRFDFFSQNFVKRKILMKFNYCLFVYLQFELDSRESVAIYDSRIDAVIRRCIKSNHVIHLILHKQIFLYIESSFLHITIDLISIKYFNTFSSDKIECRWQILITRQINFTSV